MLAAGGSLLSRRAYMLKALQVGEEPVPVIGEFNWDGNTNEIAGRSL
jgi:hypothetical protein